MRTLTVRTRTASATQARRRSERVLLDILTGPDSPHRRELEVMLEEHGR